MGFWILEILISNDVEIYRIWNSEFWNLGFWELRFWAWGFETRDYSILSFEPWAWNFGPWDFKFDMSTTFIFFLGHCMVLGTHILRGCMSANINTASYVETYNSPTPQCPCILHTPSETSHHTTIVVLVETSRQTLGRGGDRRGVFWQSFCWRYNQTNKWSGRPKHKALSLNYLLGQTHGEFNV